MEETCRSYPFKRLGPFQMPEDLAWLRIHKPVSRITLMSGDQAWLVTRHEEARAVLASEFEPTWSCKDHQWDAVQQ